LNATAIDLVEGGKAEIFRPEAVVKERRREGGRVGRMDEGRREGGKEGVAN